MRVPRSWFALTVLVSIALAVAVGIAVTIWHSPRSRVQVPTLDPRFCALSAKLLSSPNDCFYRGNQIEGRVRDFLRTRLHVKLQALEDLAPYAALLDSVEQLPPRVESHRVGYPAILALHFSFLDAAGSVAPVPPASAVASSPPVTLELRDPSDEIVQGGGLFHVVINPFYMLLNLDTYRTRAGNYKVRLLRAGVCLAEVEIRDLPPLTPPDPFPVSGTNWFPFLGKYVL